MPRPVVGPKDGLEPNAEAALGDSKPGMQPEAGGTVPRPTAAVQIKENHMDLLRSSDQLNPQLPKTTVPPSLRVSRTPLSVDRRKQLEEWVALKGRIYKRPPMRLLRKQAVKPPCRTLEKREDPAEQGCLGENNRLNQRLVEEPLQELREVVPAFRDAATQTSEAEKPKQTVPCKPATPWPGEQQLPACTPGSLPQLVKYQVTSVPREREVLEGPQLKYLTPVRRSLRVERAGSSYPEMLRDHDPVVSSLSEILDSEKDTQFFFRRNKALPEVTELEGLSSCDTNCC